MSLRHWVWLSQAGAPLGARLLEAFGSPERVFDAGRDILRAAENPQERELLGALCEPHAVRAAEQVLIACAGQGTRLVALCDAAYPDRLRNIENPPLVLYCRGQLPVLDDEVCVGVVGTRHAPPSALRIAGRIAQGLSRAGVCVVSGMAQGIDTAAHEGALRGTSPTVAVFGCGTDVCYPASNRELMHRIERQGCILSEYAPTSKPERHHFPARNRIISGLSMGVLLVGAPQRSGSLITAARALDQGRDVFVVPGGADDPVFEGSNALLKLGAVPVTEADDILLPYYASYPALFEMKKKKDASPSGAFSFAFRKRRDKVQKTPPVPEPTMDAPPSNAAGGVDREALIAALTPQDQPIIRLLFEGRMHVDRIVSQTGIETGEVLARLTILEVEGLIRELPGRHFELVSG